jgi:uncharacterized protein YhfF
MAVFDGSSVLQCARLTRMAKTMSFGYDGDGGVGDRLLAAVLSGEKTATSSRYRVPVG